MAVIEYFNYYSWKEFKADFIAALYANSEFVDGEYLFRGQSNSEWSIISSLDRFIENRSSDVNRIEFQNYLIDSFKRFCETSGNDIDEIESDIHIIALAQHNALPTRLVDWSYSPYTAAFFAFSGIGLSKDIPKQDVAIYALNTKHTVWKEEAGVEIILGMNKNNRHQLNQRGVFTYNRSAEKSIEEFLEYMDSKGKNVNKALFKIQIPAEYRREALLDLTAMGITHASLFSGYESCATASLLAAINEYFPAFNPSIV